MNLRSSAEAKRAALSANMGAPRGAETFAERLCFALCKRIFIRQGHDLQLYTMNNSTYARQAEWRREDAAKYLEYFQRTVDLKDKVVLDYACGQGAIASAIRVLAKPAR